MKKLHMIGNAHLDPVWLWRWQEGFQENKATFRSALDRLMEYDDVVFTSSSAQFYEWVEKNDPEMFEEIGRRIREGRWVICGGWWVQPDCNLPCGESFARQALLSQNYFKEKFGVTAKTGYNVDSFGHNGMLPQLLRLSGMENYVFMRPGPHEKGLPGGNFIWESDDGSRVTAFRIPFSYCTFGDLQKHMQAVIQQFDPAVPHMMCFYGVGNHGGGPTIENIEAVKSFSEEGVEVVFDHPDSYFQALGDYALPVVHGDLQHHASGCYSAQSEVKTMNRRAENALLRAETFSSLSCAMGRSAYPENFNEGWKRVLFNQFHDILAGSAIREAYDDTRNEFGEALSIACRNENNALQAISFKVGIPKEDGMLPVIVFNPHSWEVSAPVEVETGMFRNQNPGESYRVLDSAGREIPSQLISSSAKVNGRIRLVFKAQVPALGYAVFRIFTAPQAERRGTGGADVLENELVRVRIDEKSGGVSSLYLKASDTELMKGSGAVAAVIEDDSDTWSHDVLRFDKIKGYFTPVSIKKTEDGPVRESIRVISRFESSTLVQTFTLYRGEQDVHVSARVNWQGKFQCLKLCFPMRLEQCRGTYGIPFGSIEKQLNGEEEPLQKWMDLTGMKSGEKDICGMSVLNDCKYSASMEHGTMSMTVLRSPVYAHHNPHVLTEEPDDYFFIDQGIQEFCYVMTPHEGSWKEAETVQKALELNQPCAAYFESFHPGELPQKAGYIHVNCKNVLLSSFKKAEKGEGYALRFYETWGTPTEAVIDLPLFGKSIHASFRPHEIKTFLVDASAQSKPVEANLLEWEKD